MARYSTRSQPVTKDAPANTTPVAINQEPIRRRHSMCIRELT
jgi:hypothetical protein